MPGGARQTQVDGEGREEDEKRGKNTGGEDAEGQLGKQAEAEGKENGIETRKKNPQLAYQNGSSLVGEQGECEWSAVRGPENSVERARKGSKRGVEQQDSKKKDNKEEEKRKTSRHCCSLGGQRAGLQAATEGGNR